MADPTTSSSIRKHLLAARRSLSALDRSLKRLAFALLRTVRSGRPPRRRTALSPKARASLVLQGRYMGYMRQLKPAQKAMVRSVLAKSGKKAAIRRAQELRMRRIAA